MNPEELLDLDRRHVWHPYASALEAPQMFPVVSAKGVRLTLADGRELIDGMASWWCAIHGYNHPTLNHAASEQMQQMSHVMFGGLTHPAAVKLCKTLVDLTPAPLQRVFLSDSGSVSVEVALKMALQYWQAKGKSDKQHFVALRNGYHGDTFGAMSVCDPATGMHHLFGDVLPKHFFVAAPACGFSESFEDQHIEEMQALLAEKHQQLAAVIVEPVVQGAGGMRFYSPEYLVRLRELCDQYGVLLIFDEIATGFGRTGKFFALEHAAVCPDIMCLGKAITGGYLSLAATLCSEEVAVGISAGEAGAFMHGPTFMGNPLACAIANASIELLLEDNWQSRVSQLQSQLEQGLAAAQDLPGVHEVRCLGAIGVIELKEAVDMRQVQPMFVERGVWVRPFGKLVYAMPPYVMGEDDVATLTAAMVEVVSEIQ
jgi:adenosylmethionine-8-amino-7-oxononanoate aminotransferase